MKLTDAQVASVAAFERAFGRALIVPAGPRRDACLKWAAYGAVAVQSAEAYMHPVVMVVEPSGFELEALPEVGFR